MYQKMTHTLEDLKKLAAMELRDVNREELVDINDCKVAILDHHLLRNLPILPNWCRPFSSHPLMSARCQVLDNIFHKFLF